ncbi:MAG: hypothetical protein JZU67_08340, partial [Burkholderiaceae bacterium]|nr:hypothetical protein [Burkholderiaceae bacterium]
MSGNAHDISFSNCQVSANLHYGGFVSIHGQSTRIAVNNSRFICSSNGTAIQITGAGEEQVQDNVILQPGEGVNCEVV